MGVLCLQRNDIERREGRGTRLRGDHAAKACHVPRAHVIIFRADGHEVLLAQHHFHDWISMNHECLEELWSVAYGLGVLHDYSHCSRAGTVCNLDPVPT